MLLFLSAGDLHVKGTYRCYCFSLLVTFMLQVQVLLCLSAGDLTVTGTYRCYCFTLLVTSMLQVQVLLFISVGDLHVTGTCVTVSLLMTSVLQVCTGVTVSLCW